ncbi:MAG: glycosyltransferase family 4 protein [Actinobacteria bacterium]|nr:glycosyltransferase family 4 protein [Actinomycetota bacterium]MBU1942390.1 glycosyltransferase family 4 protein [Actinomycetota bacterium]MBU2686262.1 glycosyltransferase family 4 protein [Actinomycetota bacterium]
MNILFVVKEFPHSRVIGGPIIIYNRVKYLARAGHAVSLVAFKPYEPSPEQVESIARYCEDLRLVPPVPRRGAMRRARDFCLGPVPPYFMLNYSEEMYEAIRVMVRDRAYDVAVSEYSMVAQYLYRNPDLEGIRRVMSVHECYYLARRKVRQVQGLSREGLAACLQLKGLKEFEFDMYADADKVLTLTEEGRDELLVIRPGLDISVVPHGVDTEGFRPVERPPGPPTVMFLGNYLHDPNRDAMVWFATEGWPRLKREVPDCRFLVVGRGPTPDMQELARRDPSIVLTGTVDEVQPYFAESDVFICPVRMGGGFRGKVLEAMASGVPVVSTSLGAEGLPALDGENMVLAETPVSLAAEAVRLLRDGEAASRIAANARLLMEEKFSWQHGVEILEKVLLEVVTS